MAYILPQVQVFQDFRALPINVTANLNAFVFGPHYKLFRYAVASEKELIGLGDYQKDADATDYAYPFFPAAANVDLSYTKLYMENVLAQYQALGASEMLPLQVKSAVERNKVRSVPVLDEIYAGNVAFPNLDIAGADKTGGYLTRGVETAVYYYFYPIGGADSGTHAWDMDHYQSLLAASPTPPDEAKLAYFTSDGKSGTVSIPMTVYALDADVYIPGPDGVQLSILAGGTSNYLRRPLVVKFANGTGYFTMTPGALNMREAIDEMQNGKPTYVNVSDDDLGGSGVPTVTWTAATRTLDIVLDNDGTPASTVTTLQQLYDALAADSDVMDNFDLTDITAGAAVAISAVGDAQDSGADYWDATDYDMIPTAWRLHYDVNSYVFATGNGYALSGAYFKSRGAKVGDYVRYQATVGATVYEGMSKVVGIEADVLAPEIHPATVDVDNAAAQAATTLPVTSVGCVTIGEGNVDQDTGAGADTRIVALDGAKSFTGSLQNGLISDTFTITITTAGAPGLAKATVVNSNGTLRRTAVPVEVGADAKHCKIYLGYNLYLQLHNSVSDIVLSNGDTFTFTDAVDSVFGGVSTDEVVSSGEYLGEIDTTYVLEVIRGGAFNRAVRATPGLQIPGTPPTVTPSIDWDHWLGGDADDEYILICTTGGNLATAIWRAISRRGDNEDGIVFGSALTDVAVGAHGLEVQFSADDTFTAGDYWVITVDASRPQLRVTDTAGYDQSSYVVVGDDEAVAIGLHGAEVTFTANHNTQGGYHAEGGLRKGDKFYVECKAAAGGRLSTLVLADDISGAVVGLNADETTNPHPTNVALWLYLVQATAQIQSKKVQAPPDYNWRGFADKVTVYGGIADAAKIAVQDSSWTEPDGSMPYLPIYSGTMYLEYRALLADYADSIYSIHDISDVAAELGTVHPDNPLAQGVYNALLNSGDQPVYFMAVPSSDLLGFSAVLDRATLTDSVYAFAPLTQDAQILAAVEGHINSMSTETEKRWRIGFVGTALPTLEPILTEPLNPDDEDYLATVTEWPLDPGHYLYVTVTNGAPHLVSRAKVNDEFRCNFATDAWGDATYDTYLVDRVLSNNTLLLKTGPGSAINVPAKCELYHPRSVPEIATAVAAQSSYWANRRICNVFPSEAYMGGVEQDSPFIAAAVAGLVSAVPPQQGLTNIELNGFDDLPQVYRIFNREQLNEMAEKGTMIVMQDQIGSRVYIRHQVTTDQSGNLLKTELSITKNLDAISYYFADVLALYIGRYNITPEILAVIRNQIQSGLNYLGSYTGVGLLGPMVILDDATVIRTVEQHPTLQDHIVAIVALHLPLPLNVIELHLVV